MQSKQYDEAELATIPASTGINTLVIEVTDSHRLNFHGIHFQGRLHGDNALSNAFQNGYVALLCVPNDQVALSGIFGIADMRDWNAMIIAIQPFSLYNRVTAGSSTGERSMFDFDIAPKTSRTCAEGGKIVGQVTNVGLGNVIVNTLLSTFSTTV